MKNIFYDDMTFFLFYDWGLYFYLIAKTACKKIDVSGIYLLQRLGFISLNLSTLLTWSNPVVFGLVLNYFLGMLDKLKKLVYRAVGPKLADYRESLGYRRTTANQKSFS